MSAEIEVDTGHQRHLRDLLAWLCGRERAHEPERAGERHPAQSYWPVTICVMLATIMQALDTTIANVALPYMQGTLSATQDQVNWVLTSYIVAAAIMTPPTGWLAARFGRKRLFLVAGRRLHRGLDPVRPGADARARWCCSGCCRACAAPRWCRCRRRCCSTPSRARSTARPWRSGASASWSARSSGPTLGGWLTESYSWRWVFYINLPVGILDLPRPDHLPARERAGASIRASTGSASHAQPRHRRAPAHARPRRAARLVRLGRDHRRGDRRRPRLLPVPRPHASPPTEPFVEPAPVPRPQFRGRRSSSSS